MLIDGLRSRGHDIVFLQHDRDRTEAGLDLSHDYTWDDCFPEIDALFLEWRWPIPGRNTTACGTAGHTCDLHRQQLLLSHYTQCHGTPTIVWDKDRKLPSSDPLRQIDHVVVCEAALSPTPGAVRLLFPVADEALATADPVALAAAPRPRSLAYVGNQYDRDEAFDSFFAPAAAAVDHVVAGKWTATDSWPHVRFVGRIPFTQVREVYGSALATILLVPSRYAQAGQMTQRLPEAVLTGCLPLCPTTINHADKLVPPKLLIRDGAEAVQRLGWLRQLAGSPEHVELLAGCVRRLQRFSLREQLATLDFVFDHLTTSSGDISAVEYA
ncbi:hypothetical protein [Actinophytocola sp.]|uniref:hypothetical protein n=1 Tax=Actinophytocola sp. TaxID=1872138 RepID=UPI00389B1CED